VSFGDIRDGDPTYQADWAKQRRKRLFDDTAENVGSDGSVEDANAVDAELQQGDDEESNQEREYPPSYHTEPPASQAVGAGVRRAVGIPPPGRVTRSQTRARVGRRGSGRRRC